MASIQELKQARLAKLERLQEAGVDVYNQSFNPDFSLGELAQKFVELEKAGNQHKLAGRVVAVRGQGAILFVVLRDGADDFQVVFKKDEMDEEVFGLFADTVDVGDFIGVHGSFFTTQRGQQSLLAQQWTMLSKALLPLPEKWAGLSDTEEKYRRRYLDLISDQNTFDRFVLRSKIVAAIRNFFDSRGFLEIETPILQQQAGGAMARTFDTHHNDYDMDMVMRISLEIEHKMLMAGGFSRIYEIGKNFRNEGSDPTHIQEFTMIEWYAAYKTLDDNIAWTEELLKHLAKDVVGKETFTVLDKNGEGQEVSFVGAWPRVNFADLLRDNANLDMQTASLEEIQSKAAEYGMSKEEVVKTSKGNLLDFIYKKSSRNNIINPTFVMNYPSELKPLAQQNEDGTAKVAQLIIAGAEITNQYAELIDPRVQKNLLEQQASAREAGDDEAMEVNHEFIEAMEHGMPPMTGFGMGIDRIVALLTDQHNLRDTIFFPIMRPKDE
jgi:lysyl-tRNA synthetase class 2